MEERLLIPKFVFFYIFMCINLCNYSLYIVVISKHHVSSAFLYQKIEWSKFINLKVSIEACQPSIIALVVYEHVSILITAILLLDEYLLLVDFWSKVEPAQVCP